MIDLNGFEGENYVIFLKKI